MLIMFIYGKINYYLYMIHFFDIYVFLYTETNTTLERLHLSLFSLGVKDMMWQLLVGELKVLYLDTLSRSRSSLRVELSVEFYYFYSNKVISCKIAYFRVNSIMNSIYTYEVSVTFLSATFSIKALIALYMYYVK